MTEEQPFRGDEEIEPTRLPLKGPNVISTLDVPPRPDALKAQQDAVRRHLQSRRGGQEPAGG